MTKQNLQIALECIAVCNQSGLLAINKLSEVGDTVTKITGAIERMKDGDQLIIQKAKSAEIPQYDPEKK